MANEIAGNYVRYAILKGEKMKEIVFTNGLIAKVDADDAEARRLQAALTEACVWIASQENKCPENYHIVKNEKCSECTTNNIYKLAVCWEDVFKKRAQTATCVDCKNKDICAVWNPKHYTFIDTKTICNQFEKEKDE